MKSIMDISQNIKNIFILYINLYIYIYILSIHFSSRNLSKDYENSNLENIDICNYNSQDPGMGEPSAQGHLDG